MSTSDEFWLPRYPGDKGTNYIGSFYAVVVFFCPYRIPGKLQHHMPTAYTKCHSICSNETKCSVKRDTQLWFILRHRLIIAIHWCDGGGGSPVVTSRLPIEFAKGQQGILSYRRRDMTKYWHYFTGLLFERVVTVCKLLFWYKKERRNRVPNEIHLAWKPHSSEINRFPNQLFKWIP